MSFLERISYQIKKCNHRNVKVPPVSGIIFSENSSEHWRHLFVDNMNVLDMGVGRWGINDLPEMSPVYFKLKNAKKIIGIDVNENEIAFFSTYFNTHFADESLFIKKFINTPGDISDLTTAYNINSIKCDIEGYETNLFKLDLSQFLSLKHLSIEYHSPVLLKGLIQANTLFWKFIVVDHSIFSDQPHMGVLTLSRKEL